MTIKKSIFIVCLSTVFIIFVTLNKSYSLSKSKYLLTDASINTNCVEIEVLNEGKSLRLRNKFPLTNEQGKNISPFVFKVKNNCDMNIYYDIGLDILNTTDIDISYINGVLDTKSIFNLGELNNNENILNDVKLSKKITTGVLFKNEEKEYNLRLWLDQNVELTSELENKTFEAKLTVSTNTEIGPKNINKSKILCKRANKLHTEKCLNNDLYCANDIGYNSKIKYGNELTMEGYLNVGDAFTCDVNGDNIFDEETERFYYISSLFDVTNSTKDKEIYDENTAVLIYYSNTLRVDDKMYLDNKVSMVYNNTELNNEGISIESLNNLPTTSEWKNIKLINSERKILSEYTESKTNAGDLKVTDYSNYVSRLLTYQEIKNACGENITNLNSLSNNKCSFLLENTHYTNPNYVDYWLETPYGKSKSLVYLLSSKYAQISLDTPQANTNNFYSGIRPVIEVKLDNIEY